METVIFKIDGKLKKAAQKRARLEGISLTDYYRSATKSFVDGQSNVGFVSEERFNAKTTREIRQALKEIKQGKGLSPAFSNAEEAINYLKSL